VASYRDELLTMGAPASDIEVVTDHDESGGVSVVATWIKADTESDEAAPGHGAG
jgi:hypothetical protein